MANFIPPFTDAVIRKDKEAFLAITAITGHLIPFVKKNDCPIRADGYIGKTHYVEKENYDAAFRQVTKIFSENRESAEPGSLLEPIIIEVSKDLTRSENERITVLAKNKIRFRDDGSLILYHRTKMNSKENVKHTFNDVCTAIRSLGHIIDKFQGRLKRTEELEKIQCIIKSKKNSKIALENEKKTEEAIIKNANIILKAIVSSSDKTLVQYNIIESRINFVLDDLRSIWLNPFFEQVTKARLILNAAKRYSLRMDANVTRIMVSAAVTMLS